MRADEPVVRPIYEWLEGLLAQTPDGLPDSSIALPEEAAEADLETVRFASGARDGIATHHMAAGGGDDEVATLFGLIVAFGRAPSDRAAASVEAYATERTIVSIVDPLLERVRGGDTPSDAIHALAVRLATRGTRAEPVKLGIALLGVPRGPPDDVVLTTLGSHDEFALFAGVATGTRGGDATLLWRMARRVNGWGRIHLVERLVRDPDLDDEIRAWLLRDGYRNSVMDEYLALSCADAGRLAEALAADRLAPATLGRLARLIDTSIRADGGPAAGIGAYDRAADALERFVGHAERAGERPLDVLAALRAIVDASRAGTLDAAENGWSHSRRDGLVARCDAILDGAATRLAIDRGVLSDDNETFAVADALAGHLAIDRWPARWAFLRRRPDDAYAFYLASELVDADRLDAFLAHARHVAPPETIATGATMSLGLGPGFEAHRLFDTTLQMLERFPRHGEEWIAAALRSPVIRHRGKAALLISRWPGAPLAIANALREAARVEPHDDTRRRMTNVLEGRPIDEA